MSTYKTKKIDELDIASELQDGCQIPICQDGTAKKLTGAQLRAYVESAAKEQTSDEVHAMTVSASTLDSGERATVKSSINADGTLNLVFGLPRGDVGPEGPTGPRGRSMYISGRYDTIEEVPDPQDGENYYIGAVAPYHLYTYVGGEWLDCGELQVPSDVVLYTAQDLTEEQQAQARANLGIDQIIGDISAALDAINGEVV